MSEPVKITESCGCVFCDLGLEPDGSTEGRPTHSHPTRGRGWSFCTKFPSVAAPSSPEQMPDAPTS